MGPSGLTFSEPQGRPRCSPGRKSSTTLGNVVVAGEMKRTSVLDPDATWAAVHSPSPRREPSDGPCCPPVPQPTRGFCISQKKEPIMNRSYAEHSHPPASSRGAHVSEGCIFFCCVDVSFLIYRIFFNVKIALNSINVNAAFCSSYKKKVPYL